MATVLLQPLHCDILAQLARRPSCRMRRGESRLLYGFLGRHLSAGDKRLAATPCIASIEAASEKMLALLNKLAVQCSQAARRWQRRRLRLRPIGEPIRTEI